MSGGASRSVGLRELPGFLRDLGMTPTAHGFAYEREAQLWAVDWQGLEAVVRRLDPAALLPPGEEAVVASRQWIHRYLSSLVPTGFPVPVPLPVFEGESLVLQGEAVWEVLSYLPGEPVGWAGRPTMVDVGAFLARFHNASEAVAAAADQRPGAMPLAEVPSVLSRADWSALTDDRAAVDRLQQLSATLDAELEALGAPPWEQGPVHGDLTTMNVLAGTDPPRPVGLIDFGGAYMENPVADVGFGLWQSGRPEFQAASLDPARVGALVAGYTSVRPLPAMAARAIPVYIFGRGLQMVAKRVRFDLVHLGSLPLIGWVHDHLDDLEAVIARRLVT